MATAKPNTPSPADTAAQQPSTASTPVAPVTQPAPVAPVQPVIPPQTSIKPPTAATAQPPFSGHSEAAPAAHQSTHTQDGPAPPKPTAAAPVEPRARAEDAPHGSDSVLNVTAGDYEVPEAFAHRPGVDLLMKVCTLFGVDPNPRLPVFVAGKHTPTATTRFRELMNWSYTPGDEYAGVPDKVTIVTAGGRKLTVDGNGEFDSDTDAMLHQAFNAYRVNPTTNEREESPLPYDLTLPQQAVIGIVTSDRHRYRRGYLNEGGRAEADRRERAEVEARRAAFHRG